jgi:hypothetical protein
LSLRGCGFDAAECRPTLTATGDSPGIAKRLVLRSRKMRSLAVKVLLCGCLTAVAAGSPAQAGKSDRGLGDHRSDLAAAMAGGIAAALGNTGTNGGTNNIGYANSGSGNIGAFNSGTGNVGAFNGVGNTSLTSGNTNIGAFNGNFNSGLYDGNGNIGAVNGNFNGGSFNGNGNIGAVNGNFNGLGNR